MRALVGTQVVLKESSAKPVFKSHASLNEITPDQEGERVTVYGRVSAVWKPKADSRAPYKIVLQDYSGSLDVVHWQEDHANVRVEDELEITGAVTLYDGRLQLKVRKAEDIQPYAKNRARGR